MVEREIEIERESVINLGYVLFPPWECSDSLKGRRKEQERNARGEGKRRGKEERKRGEWKEMTLSCFLMIYYCIWIFCTIGQIL